MRQRTLIRTFLSTLLLSFLLINNLFAQTELEESLHAIANDEGEVYIYHEANLSFLNGYHVERRVEGEEWERLTDTPVYPANGGAEFMYSAEEYMPVLQEATNRETPQEVYLALMTRQTVSIIASSVYPEVAEALGRLFIDEDPILNQNVEYRFIVVNSNQNPTGRVLQNKFYLEPGIPSTPTNVTAANRGKEVTLNWEYTNSSYTEDGVSRFVIVGNVGGESEILFEPGIYRVDGRTNYSYTIDVDMFDREYTFSLVAVDITGQYSEPSESFTIEVTDNIPPRSITGVRSARYSENSVELSWNVSVESKVTGYNVYRTLSRDEDFELITDEPLDLLENVFRDTNLMGGQHYRYYITAIDGNGNESEPSNVASIIIEEYLPPIPVDSLRLQINDAQEVVLEWDQTESEEFNSYVILRKQIYPEEAESYSRVNRSQQKENRFIDRGIGEEFPEGLTYRYGIAVSGVSGLQSDTTFQDIQIPLITPPDPPTGVTVSRGEGNRINISWGASPSQTVTTYEVNKVLQIQGDHSGADITDLEQEGEVTFIGTAARGDRFIRESNTEPGFTYVYQVTAIDSAGNESSPLYSDPIFNKSQSVPQAVRNLQVRFMDNENHLRWEASSNPDLTAYRIYRSDISTGSLKLIGEVEPETLDWQDSEGSPGNWYLVRAVDSSGNLSPRTRLIQAVE